MQSTAYVFLTENGAWQWNIYVCRKNFLPVGMFSESIDYNFFLIVAVVQKKYIRSNENQSTTEE